MRKTTYIAATLSLLAAGTLAAGTAFGQSAPTSSPSPAPSAHAHQQGMDHGGQQMHDQMMRDHQAGMQKHPNQANMPGMAGTPDPSGMSAKPKAGCCKGKKKPMSKGMSADKPMTDM